MTDFLFFSFQLSLLWLYFFFVTEGCILGPDWDRMGMGDTLAIHTGWTGIELLGIGLHRNGWTGLVWVGFFAAAFFYDTSFLIHHVYVYLAYHIPSLRALLYNLCFCSGFWLSGGLF